MKLNELTDKLELRTLNCGQRFDQQVSGGYVSDLLSDVMGHAEAGEIWITLQAHRNTIAVASLKELAAIVLTGGAEPAPEMLELAREEGVTVLASDLPAFELAGRAYALIHPENDR